MDGTRGKVYRSKVVFFSFISFYQVEGEGEEWGVEGISEGEELKGIKWKP